MSSETLAVLQTLETAILTDVVRQDQQEPNLELTDWSVASLSNKGAANPDGLFLFSGEARLDESTRPWSVVLKVLKKPNHEQELHELNYWKREATAAQSGMLAHLPGPFVTPRFYGTKEFDTSTWLWMEHIHDTRSGLWTLDDYAFAARKLGQFNGAYLTGTPLPSEPWLCQRHARQRVGITNPEHTNWENPFVRRYLPEDVRAESMQIWEEREQFYDALDRLPQVFSHFDYNRRNLLIRQKAGGQKDLVAIDWAWCGIGPVGGDLNSLVGGSCMFFEWEPSRIAELEEVALEAYVAGLRDVGWQGDADLARLGYTAWVTLVRGVAFPSLMSMFCNEEQRETVFRLLERSLDEAASGWAKMCEFSLSRADEARELMTRLLPNRIEEQRLRQELPAV